MGGSIVATLFMLGVLLAEHALRDVMYDSMAEKHSAEFIRRLRISYRVGVLLIIAFAWSVALLGGLRDSANMFFYIVMVCFVCLSTWTMLGDSRKELLRNYHGLSKFSLGLSGPALQAMSLRF